MLALVWLQYSVHFENPYSIHIMADLPKGSARLFGYWCGLLRTFLLQARSS